MKLVDNWRDSWSWISMRCMGLATTIQGAWIATPDDMRATIPVWLVSGLTIVLLVMGVIGRLVKQK